MTHRFAAFVASACLALCIARPAHAGWGEDALSREAGYICDCSYTEFAANHGGISPASDAYGAINDIRLAGGGPNWVQTTEAAVGAVGLMQAARQLRASGQPADRYDAVLDRFFTRWVLSKGQCRVLAGDDRGAFASRVYYTPEGAWRKNDLPNSGATGAMICAMWKYADYLQATGRARQASAWLRDAYPAARLAGGYITRQYDPEYGLVHSSGSLHNLWISDAVYGEAGLRCLRAWTKKIGKPDAGDGALAQKIAAGISAMRASSGNFYKFRDNTAGYRPAYGDSIDQLCFFPYQAGVVEADARARKLSDWWTRGGDGVTMTPQTADTADWRYYGTRWHYYFDNRRENAYLYPGPGLQLAMVEWRAGRALHAKELADRAGLRFEWANRKDRSGLWLGATGQSEAWVSNGVVDWRDSTNYAHCAPLGDRFVDTSAYFIEVTLMICWNKDTLLTP